MGHQSDIYTRREGPKLSTLEKTNWVYYDLWDVDLRKWKWRKPSKYEWHFSDPYLLLIIQMISERWWKPWLKTSPTLKTTEEDSDEESYKIITIR